MPNWRTRRERKAGWGSEGHRFPMSAAYGRKEKLRLRLPCNSEIDHLDSMFDRDDFAERKIGTEKIWDDPMW